MAKHTPGPWSKTYFAKTHAVHSKSGECIAVCDSSLANNEENARLIAAAPELLESLEKLVRELHEAIYTRAANTWATPEVAYEHANQLTQSYRDLIVKAKGEA